MLHLTCGSTPRLSSIKLCSAQRLPVGSVASILRAHLHLTFPVLVSVLLPRPQLLAPPALRRG